jgi:hypothetical protein
MAKWTLTDAAAKRIFKHYIGDDERTLGSPYQQLRKALKAEDMQAFNATGAMLIWIGQNHPQHLPLLASDIAYRYEQLLGKSRKFMGALDALSCEVQWNHYHRHESGDS